MKEFLCGWMRESVWKLDILPTGSSMSGFGV